MKTALSTVYISMKIMFLLILCCYYALIVILYKPINIYNKTLGNIGNKGQEKLLKLKRNYKIRAEQLALKLNEVLVKD